MNDSHSPQPLTRRRGAFRPLLIYFLGVTSALCLVVIMADVMLKAPKNDLILLVVYLGFTGVFSLVASYALYKLGLTNWFRSVRWSLLAMIVLTVGLIFLNVWVTARLMFIQEHDLGLTTLLLIFAGISAVSFGYFISSALTERIMALSKGAEQVASGNLGVQIQVKGNDELASLAATFNEMAKRLQDAADQKQMLEQTRRDLVAWVSHDLRTPLTSLQVMIEALADGVVSDPQTVNRYLKTAQSEIHYLSHLIDDLFELAQLDAGHSNLRCESSSLRDLISDTLESMHTRAEQEGIRLQGQVQNGIDPVTLDSEKIQRVLNNLIGNAIAHTAPGGQVQLRARQIGAEVQIDVRDTGEGIAPDDLIHVFERFYRGEKSRSRDDNGLRGAGLGLAIAKGFVEAHGGRIWVESKPGKGASFSFTLPRPPLN